MGSANFTRSGILSDGNWECLLHFTKDEKLYKDALDAARRHFDAGIGFDECDIYLLCCRFSLCLSFIGVWWRRLTPT